MGLSTMYSFRDISQFCISSVRNKGQKLQQGIAFCLLNQPVIFHSIPKLNRTSVKESPAETISDASDSRLKIEHTCFCVAALVGLTLLATLLAVLLTKESPVEVTKLRQIHVVMSHGERTPNDEELDTLGVAPERHTFAPYGVGAMTNEGKLLTYEMGALLRRRYEHFLGDVYLPDDTIITASDTELSKMTALLAAAGLWPPSAVQAWNETLPWQPIPYTYPRYEDDYMLFDRNCPRYLQEKQQLLDQLIEEGDLIPFKDLFNRISHLTETNFTRPIDAYNMYNLFEIQEELKVANPKWAKHVKRKLADAARLELNMMFEDNLMKKLSGGVILNKIVEASENLKPRLYVYAWTPRGVAAVLAAAVAPPPRLPDPAAAILFELHEIYSAEGKSMSDLGYKIYYWDDDTAEPKLMEVPGCEEVLCPIKKFLALTKDVRCQDYKTECEIVEN